MSYIQLLVKELQIVQRLTIFCFLIDFCMFPTLPQTEKRTNKIWSSNSFLSAAVFRYSIQKNCFIERKKFLYYLSIVETHSWGCILVSSSQLAISSINLPSPASSGEITFKEGEGSIRNGLLQCTVHETILEKYISEASVQNVAPQAVMSQLVQMWHSPGVLSHSARSSSRTMLHPPQNAI